MPRYYQLGQLRIFNHLLFSKLFYSEWSEMGVF